MPRFFKFLTFGYARKIRLQFLGRDLKVYPCEALRRMRMKGLEPSRPKTPEPKSGASTNSATSARSDNDINHNRYVAKSK